ncbi:MAG: 6-phosphofructokinase [Planctomycetes bacterium]|nr:6-phosphofructokinase [Planctomycetota bacterium]
MKAPRGNALIGQSGGPTCVINQSLVGIVEAAKASKNITRVFGALHGIKGILEGKLIDVGKESKETLEGVARTPCAALRSVRKKPTREECQQALALFKKHDIRYFFYIGGNDSAETTHIFNELAVAENYDVHVFHVPKTIDNDLRVNDHCPGYGSAARFVAQAMMGDNLDNRSLPGIKIDIVMGRNAGWLTAASVLARVHPDDGPHLVYVPEKVFSLERFVADVERVYKQHGRCLVAASEGIHDAAGKTLVDSKEKDSHGNAQLSGSGALGDFLAAHLKQKLGDKLRVRADTFGYLQRSFPGVISPSDAKEARQAGRTAVKLAQKHRHGSVALIRTPGEKYAIRFEHTELKNVAKDTRAMEASFLKGDNDIDPSFLEYVRPLAGELPTPVRLSDFPLG